MSSKPNEVLEGYQSTLDMLQIHVVTNNPDDIDRAREQRPDLILVEVLRETMGGLETIRRFKADVQTKAVPILAIAPKAVPGDRDLWLEKGCDGYLAKPFSLEELRMEVDKLLKKRLLMLLGNKKVLVVEDHEDTAELLQMQLEQAGNADVLIATNGLEALDKVREQRPDLILMDIMLPIMDGCEVTRKLKGDPQTRPIPILAVTARVTPGDRAVCLESGCDGYLPKPFVIEQLKTEITKVLTRADLVRRSH